MLPVSHQEAFALPGIVETKQHEAHANALNTPLHIL